MPVVDAHLQGQFVVGFLIEEKPSAGAVHDFFESALALINDLSEYVHFICHLQQPDAIKSESGVQAYIVIDPETLPWPVQVMQSRPQIESVALGRRLQAQVQSATEIEIFDIGIANVFRNGIF